MSAIAVDETGGSAGFDALPGGGIDEASFNASEESRGARQNRAVTRPYRKYLERVVEASGVQKSHATRQMASNICSVVAALPFVPDAKTKVAGKDVTEFEEQVRRTATLAEESLGSNVVWTSAAIAITRTALEFRAKDPDGQRCRETGGKEGAWVNDLHIDDVNPLDLDEE